MSEQRKIEYDTSWSCSYCKLTGVLPLRLVFGEDSKLWHCESGIERCSSCRLEHEYVPIYYADDSGAQSHHEWKPVDETEHLIFKSRMTKSVYSSLRHALGVKMMTGGAYGILDDFLRFVVSHVEKQKTEGLFEPKKKPPADAKL